MSELQRIAKQLRNAAATTYYRDATTGRYIETPYRLTELAWFRSPLGAL